MSSIPVSKAHIEPRMTYVHMTWTLCSPVGLAGKFFIMKSFAHLCHRS